MYHIKSTINDIQRIVELLAEDEFGASREVFSQQIDPSYLEAFKLIDSDPNQYLMAVEQDGVVVATCHLTIMPSLTFQGSTRMQIEAVRVSKDLRGQGIGEWMINQAKLYGESRGASLLQLSTNKERPKAKHFYEKLGFQASHEGMKMRV
jgi:ribosomal protein S18 acetylase RimI-like enzyme